MISDPYLVISAMGNRFEPEKTPGLRPLRACPGHDRLHLDAISKQKSNDVL
jgi:hypothetical protein